MASSNQYTAKRRTPVAPSDEDTSSKEEAPFARKHFATEMLSKEDKYLD